MADPHVSLNVTIYRPIVKARTYNLGPWYFRGQRDGGRTCYVMSYAGLGRLNHA